MSDESAPQGTPALVAGLVQRGEPAAAELCAVLESIPDAVYIGGPDGITLANQSALDQLGFSSLDDLNRPVGKLAEEIVTRDAETGISIAVEDQAFSRALRGERVVQVVRIRRRSDAQERLVRCAASPVLLDGQVIAAVAVNTDLTDQWQAQESLRRSQERHSFLLQLSDRIRDLSNPESIERQTCKLLAEYMNVERACYFEIDVEKGTAVARKDFLLAGAPSLAGIHRLADFAWSVAILRRGECCAIPDTQNSLLVPPEFRPASAALQITACMGAPLIKHARLVGAICVTSSRPREWTSDEVQLLREVGERIWFAIERAGAQEALRISEEQQRFLLWFADSLRRFKYIEEIQLAAAHMLREHLKTDRVAYAVLEPNGDDIRIATESKRDDMPSVIGRYPFVDIADLFAHSTREGGTFVIEDIYGNPRVPAAWAALNIRSVIAHALLKNEPLAGVLLVHAAAPRRWSDAEVTLVEEVGERIWIATQRVRAEAALHAGKARLQAIAHLAIDAIYCMSPDWSTMYQLDSGKLIADTAGASGTWLDKYILAEDRPLVMAAIHRAIETRTIFDLEHRVIRMDGSIGWTHLRALPIIDSADQITEWIGAATDITRQKSEEEALRKSLGNTQAELRALSQHLLTTQDEERRRIARELHDDLGQRAALMNWRAAELDQLWPAMPSEAKKGFAALRADLDDLASRLRDVSHQLHPAVITDLGLPIALQHLVNLHREHGVDVSFVTREFDAFITTETATALYRIAQEALRNAVQHAPSAPVLINLKSTAGIVALIVEDAGPGFELDEVRKSGGLGLLNIQERARSLGGTLEITSTPDSGTRIEVHVPLHPVPA